MSRAHPGGGATEKLCGKCSSLLSGTEEGKRHTAAAMVIKLYYTTVTASREVKSQQARVICILDSKGVKYELVDISQDNALLEEMRTLSGNPNAMPPQLFNGTSYCGDHMLLEDAVEDNAVEKFLKLT
ncbi:SH3 domain-binding glutamic acid-rich-like protein 3 [Erpetoichthys calabaricus]|uniref:SH3 domain-binding glutamic acid-rich-like protein 3 n=1 Tax=Erpetoichthys calabaricus TaxID=27687 RepID=A0A8C4T4X1_ERPCA|nr:SH3 domain-binding glutamic acid-rich-like protein 3 [Erpetoichthys calabaricus]